jgi:DNA polymerase-1
MFPSFSEIVVLDAEFHTGQQAGNRPVPVCVCAIELRSGRRHRIWCEPGAAVENPLPRHALYIAFSAAAEWGCYLALDWEIPHFICDLYFEFRCLTNGCSINVGRDSLLDALAHYRCPAMPHTYKQDMRERILRGGPFAGDEQEAILKYCSDDVDATVRLLKAMHDQINLPAALERGRYSKTVARMEWNGVPVDVPVLRSLQEHWTDFRSELVRQVEGEHRYGVYEPTCSGFSFSFSAFDEFLRREGLEDVWARTPSGRVCVNDQYLEDLSKQYPRLAPLRTLRKTLFSLPHLDPPVGSDGRNRTSIRPFTAKTSRNQPRTREFVLGFPSWARSLMRAEPGYALLYVDLASAEFGIAAALSKDAAMIEDYLNGDPYIGLGKRIRTLPEHATKDTHLQEREVLKTVCLGTQYGMGSQTLALRLQTSLEEAGHLLRLHRRAYPDYWDYVDQVVETARFKRQLWTPLDWRLNDAHREKANTLRNFPMQATCAEILRLACCLAIEEGLEIVAPFHDALLAHVPMERVNDSLTHIRSCWSRASAAILDGFELRSETRPEKTVFEYPHPYVDGRQHDFFLKALAFVEYRKTTNTRAVMASRRDVTLISAGARSA